MNWVDVAGPPGCGKSSLCYPIWGDKSVGWDGKPPPMYWRLFLDEVTSLMKLVKDHPSIEAVLRMNDRSAKKMATVERMPASICTRGSSGFPEIFETRPFIQTGWVQRVLGFGWRLHEMGRDVNLIRRALWLMPVSVGVAFLEADLETILARNRARENNPATAHENRSHQVPHMLPAIAIAKEVLRDRAVPVAEIDVQRQSIEAARAEILDFASQAPCHAAALGLGSQGPLLQAPPPWWRS